MWKENLQNKKFVDQISDQLASLTGWQCVLHNGINPQEEDICKYCKYIILWDLYHYGIYALPSKSQTFIFCCNFLAFLPCMRIKKRNRRRKLH